MVLTRGLLRNPAASAVTLLTLSIGTAASAVIFSVAWAILFRPLPYAEPERLVMVWANDRQARIPRLELSLEEVEQLRRDSRTLDGIVAMLAVNVTAVAKYGGQPLQLQSNVVTRGFFETLGVRPLHGRLFIASDHVRGAPYVAVLSWEAWQRDFGGDPRAIGREIVSSEVRVTVVGVLPQHVALPRGAEVVVPAEVGRNPGDASNRLLVAIARRNAELDAVTKELGAISRRVVRGDPDERDRHVVLEPHPFVGETLGPTQHAVRLLFAMGLLVLLIALLNVAAIALARGTSSVGELGIRASVGGTRIAIALRRFVETLGLTAIGCGAGCFLAAAVLELLLRVAPRTIPRIAEVDLGVETLLFVAAVAVVAAALSSAVQTFSVSEGEMLGALRASPKSTSTRRARRTLEVLAALQIAVAIVTIVVASLLVRSFEKVASTDAGFATENVLTFHLPLRYTMSPDRVARRAFFHELLPRLRAIPGVTAAGSALMRPLEMEQGWDLDVTVEGQAPGEQRNNPAGNLLSATPGYFEAMGITTLRGRTFDARDTPESPRVTIVSESLARRFWGLDRALGKRIKGGMPGSDRPWVTVIGVVKDVRYRGLTTEKLDVYVPFTQTDWSPNYFALRTTGEPEAVLPFVRAAVAQLDRELPVVAVRTTADLIAEKLAQPRLVAIVVTLFAVTASLLALLGLYGVLAFSVAERTRELGIRIALGADASSVLALVLRRALVIAAAGALSGIALTLTWGRVSASLLSGIEVPELRVTALFALAFAAFALLASAIPAIRATRVDPVQALRAE